MITDTSDLIGQHASFQQTGFLSRKVKIAGVLKTARFTSPRLARDFDDSTAAVHKYTSTLRIATSEVPSITRSGDWIGVRIELPDGPANAWREFHLPKGVSPVHLGSDWRLEIESL